MSENFQARPASPSLASDVKSVCPSIPVIAPARELISRQCMVAVCSWCNKFLGLRPVPTGDWSDGKLTHGICAECKTKLGCYIS